ncbi:MAG: hypothetical protein ACLQUY_23390 [Ktedonobacterales bacterium]
MEQVTRAFISQAEHVIDDAIARIKQDNSNSATVVHIRPQDDVLISSWPQTWPNSSVGFSSAAGQALTQAQTYVIEYHLTGALYVYHDGTYAYTVPRMNGQFWQDSQNRQLWGAGDNWAERYA